MTHFLHIIGVEAAPPADASFYRDAAAAAGVPAEGRWWPSCGPTCLALYTGGAAGVRPLHKGAGPSFMVILWDFCLVHLEDVPARSGGSVWPEWLIYMQSYLFSE